MSLGSIPVGDSDFSLSRAGAMMITSFLISSPSLEFTIIIYLIKEFSLWYLYGTLKKACNLSDQQH